MLDPFGGVGCGGVEAAFAGLRWVGCELEQRFVDMANENFAMQAANFEALGASAPRIVQGDSRKLGEVLAMADCLQRSPPYTKEALGHPRGQSSIASGHKQGSTAGQDWSERYGDQTPGQLGSMSVGSVDAVVSSPPYAESIKGDHGETETAAETTAKRRTPGGSLGQSARHGGYGVSEGQLGGMLEAGGVDAVVSSPPFQKTDGGCKPIVGQDSGLMSRHAASGNIGYGETPGQLSALPEGSADAVVSSPPFAGAQTSDANSKRQKDSGYFAKSTNGTLTGQYAEVPMDSPGQLGNMAEGAPDAIVSSPPFEDQEPSHAQKDTPSKRRLMQRTNPCSSAASPGCVDSEYGNTEGQIGNERGDTFWVAARQIVEQCYSLLRPNGVAVWVCKDYVKNKKRVCFSDNWRRLCEACGFELVEWVQASLVSESEDGVCMFDGEKQTKRKERKSFFRRLAERKGSPRIDHEDVLFMRKRP